MFEAHSTAVIDQGAIIGEGTRIWHFTHICKGAVIGKNCSLGQNVFVANDVIMGNNVKIQNNVSVYDAVILEDDVFCGPSMVFTNVYNPRSHISRKNEYRKTLVKKGSTIGANATIVCGVTIGKYAFIGAGSVVKYDVPDYALMVGVPAYQIGFMCECGVRLNFVNEAELEINDKNKANKKIENDNEIKRQNETKSEIINSLSKNNEIRKTKCLSCGLNFSLIDNKCEKI